MPGEYTTNSQTGKIVRTVNEGSMLYVLRTHCYVISFHAFLTTETDYFLTVVLKSFWDVLET
jgi:hypothetical protein